MKTIDLAGKVAFIAGIGDNQGFGWSIARSLAEAGATLLIGVWPPVFSLLERSLNREAWDQSRTLSDGKKMEFSALYPLDALYDTMQDVPEEVREHKRYREYSDYAIQGVVDRVEREWGRIDLLVHALANAPEIQSPLKETSRKGYLAALSASTYSFLSLVTRFAPLMQKESAALTLTYRAGERVIPGYGGGMSSAKAALEQDVRTLAWELGRERGIRINALSAGPYASRAARAIGSIEEMIEYSQRYAPLSGRLEGEDVGQAVLFLLSPWAKAITGTTLYVDHGLHVMGVASPPPLLSEQEESQSNAPI